MYIIAVLSLHINKFIDFYTVKEYNDLYARNGINDLNYDMLVKTVDSVQKIGNGFVKQWNDFVQAKELDEPYPLQEAIHFAQSLQKEQRISFIRLFNKCYSTYFTSFLSFLKSITTNPFIHQIETSTRDQLLLSNVTTDSLLPLTRLLPTSFTFLQSMHLGPAQLAQLFSVDSAWTSDHIAQSIRLASLAGATPQTFFPFLRSLQTAQLGIADMDLLADRVPRDLMLDAIGLFCEHWELLALFEEGLGLSLDASSLLRWLRHHAALPSARVRALLTHPSAARLLSSTWDPSIPDATFASLLGFSVSQIDLILRHAAPLLTAPSLRLLHADPRDNRLQLAFSFASRDPRGSSLAIEEHSLWNAGQRDGWCEQTYADPAGNRVREAVFFSAGSERGSRLRWSTQKGQPGVVLVENGQEIAVQQEALGVLFKASTRTVPLRFYFVFRDGVRRISDNNGPDLAYLARLNADGAPFSPELMVHLREAFRNHPVVANFAITDDCVAGQLDVPLVPMPSVFASGNFPILMELLTMLKPARKDGMKFQMKDMEFNGDATLNRQLMFTSCILNNVNLKRFCITAEMPHLRTIVIENCMEITDVTIYENTIKVIEKITIRNCPKLCSIDINGIDEEDVELEDVPNLVGKNIQC